MRGRQYDEVITVMPKDNLEVINLNSLEAVQEMEERDEVISVEKGKSVCVHNILDIIKHVQ